jgi:hypothetical protein
MDSKIKLGLTGLKPTDLLAKGRLIVANMTGNASFPGPVPTLADLTTALDAFEDRVEAAAFGDRRAINGRNNGQKAFTSMMSQLGTYVSFVANGDSEVIESSGFEVRKQRVPTTQLGQPIDFLAIRSKKEGEIVLNWKAVSYSKAYQVEVSTTDPAVAEPQWSASLVTSRSSGTVQNLTRGMMYWFRVKAISGAMTSAYSDVALVMAA